MGFERAAMTGTFLGKHVTTARRAWEICSRTEHLSTAQRSGPRFAQDSPLEQREFELVVPLACGTFEIACPLCRSPRGRSVIRDQEFESRFLQRGIRCEPYFLLPRRPLADAWAPPAELMTTMPAWVDPVTVQTIT